MSKITRNFDTEEFSSDALNEYQLSLLQILAENLQIVRDKLQDYKKYPKKEVSISITSGVRSTSDYDRLKKAGYHPSKTSDHYFGLQLSSKPTLGAADTVYNNCSLRHEEIARKIIEWEKLGEVHFGQIIYERNPISGAEWIHLGNDPYLIFRPEIKITRVKYLKSIDGGKNYIPF